LGRRKSIKGTTGLEARKKTVIILILLVFASTSFVSCMVHNNQEVEPDSILVQPAYHLASYRSEFAHLFYETDKRIGFQIADGIFLYNYKEDRMEAAFALREGSFEPDYHIVPTMSADEKSIIISGFNFYESPMSTHFYQYDITSGKISRLDGSVMDVAKYPHPSEGRLFEALKSETWMLEDIRYYPEGSSTFYAPFKKSDIPTVTYELQDTDLDIPIAPYLILMSDGRFVFQYSLLSSYVNYGEYEIKGTEYTMSTKDGNYKFRFHKLGDSLIFDSEGSARCRLDNGTELTNGAEFALRKHGN
jgi:hypothetical protein